MSSAYIDGEIVDENQAVCQLEQVVLPMTMKMNRLSNNAYINSIQYKLSYSTPHQ